MSYTRLRAGATVGANYFDAGEETLSSALFLLDHVKFKHRHGKNVVVEVPRTQAADLILEVGPARVASSVIEVRAKSRPPTVFEV